MKHLILTGTCLLAGLVFAAAPAQPAKDAAPAKSAEQKKSGKMTLNEAREQIAAVVKDPSLMGEIMKQLDAADQKQFLVEVNKAIVSMPGSNEQKTAKFLSVEREALVNAEKGNLQNLVATMFATVPVESLTVLSDRYSEDLFNKNADSTQTFSDEQFTEIASSTVKEVAKACDGLSDAPPRDTLAVWLFEKASNDSIPGLEDRLLEAAFSDSQMRETAKSEWLAAAKESESADRFSALLGYAEAGKAPNVDVVLTIAGPQVMSATLNDLAMCVTDSSGNQIMPVTQGESATGRDTATANKIVQTASGSGSTSTETQPKTSAVVPWNPTYTREDVEKVQEEMKKEEEKKPEPKPYPYQD